MIIVDNALKAHEAEGRPVRVGMIGAGAMGMAFADVLLTETDARILMVDKRGRPGGRRRGVRQRAAPIGRQVAERQPCQRSAAAVRSAGNHAAGCCIACIGNSSKPGIDTVVTRTKSARRQQFKNS